MEGKLLYVCKTCREEFTNAAEKTIHIMQAKCAKRYFCTVCAAGFTRRYNLDQHMKKCTGVNKNRLPILIKPKNKSNSSNSSDSSDLSDLSGLSGLSDKTDKTECKTGLTDERIKQEALILIDTEIKPHISSLEPNEKLSFSKKVEANVVTYTIQFS